MNIRTNSQIGSVSNTGNSRKVSPNPMNIEEESECIYANGPEIERNTLPNHESGEKFGDLRRKLAEELQHGRRQNQPTVPNQPPTHRPKPGLGPKPPILTRPTIIPSVQRGPTKSKNSNQRSHIDLPKPPQFHPQVHISDEDEESPPSKGLNRTPSSPRPPRSSPVATISYSDVPAYMEPLLPTKPNGLGMSQVWNVITTFFGACLRIWICNDKFLDFEINTQITYFPSYFSHCFHFLIVIFVLQFLDLASLISPT